jgi:hypothetical protein
VKRKIDIFGGTGRKTAKRKKSKVKIADALWATCVKERANNECEMCGSIKLIQAHHIVPRTVYSTRYELENGVALCFRCHFYVAHKDMLKFYEYIKDVRDTKYLESMRSDTTKNDYDAIIDKFTRALKVNGGTL